MFYNPSESNKLQKVKSEIVEKILNGEIKDNIAGLKFALKKRCLPELFTETIKSMEKEGLIFRKGEVNNRSSNIHKIEKYTIEII